MARPSLDQIRSLGDFATTYRWKLIFASFPVIGGLGLPLSEELDLRCETSQIPTMTNQEIEVNIRGQKVRQAGISDFSGNQLAMTFVETLNNTMHLFLKGWRESIWSPRTGTSLDKSDYEATIILLRLDNQDNPVWQYKLEGCWLSTYDFGQLDNNGDVIRANITLNYDFFTDSPL